MHGNARLGGLLVVLFPFGASRPHAQAVAQPSHAGEFSAADTAHQPLFVVNGVVRPPSVRPRDPVPDIAPEDIESIEILKGPAAVAAYGPAAQYGAILIRLYPVPVQTPENRARQIAALNAVMLYRAKLDA